MFYKGANGSVGNVKLDQGHLGMSDPLKLDFDQSTHPTNPPDPRADQTHGPTHQTNINTKRKQIQIQIFTVTD